MHNFISLSIYKRKQVSTSGSAILCNVLIYLINALVIMESGVSRSVPNKTDEYFGRLDAILSIAKQLEHLW